MEALLFLAILAIVLAAAFAFFGTGSRTTARRSVRRAPRDVIVERPRDVVVERRPRRRRREVVVDEDIERY